MRKLILLSTAAVLLACALPAHSSEQSDYYNSQRAGEYRDWSWSHTVPSPKVLNGVVMDWDMLKVQQRSCADSVRSGSGPQGWIRDRADCEKEMAAEYALIVAERMAKINHDGKTLRNIPICKDKFSEKICNRDHVCYMPHDPTGYKNTWLLSCVTDAQ
jgi:hypothetical protein